ncbi:MAG: TIGR04372 family glycosyltransferase [Chlamydiales bacterium]|nr:TIGR04372 family glycosyltransferase [Chlamydiales bacterium]
MVAKNPTAFKQMSFKDIAKKSVKFVLRRPARLFRYFYRVVNFFIFPWIYRYYSSRLEKIPETSQVFLATRQDFGCLMTLIHYVYCWHNYRKVNTCLFVLTTEFDRVLQLVANMTPETTIICFNRTFLKLLVFLFGTSNVQMRTLNRVYAQLCAERPNALYIFERSMREYLVFPATNYIKFFDEDLKKVEEIGRKFTDAYLKARKFLDYRIDRYADFLNLYYQGPLDKPHLRADCNFELLQKNLCISVPYVVLNISRNNYFDNICKSVLTNKGTCYPERYNTVIDYLIEKGYWVVLQGRKEQPMFEPRDKFIDYSKSSYCCVQNDFALFANCAFFISSKSGPENFGTVCNIPMLGLNYTELCSMTGNLRLRYYPKFIREISTGRFLSWQEMLKSPVFFDLGHHAFLEDVEYVEMQEEELIAAVDEFLPSVTNPKQDWLKLTEKQREFKNLLNPGHMDLYYIKGLPCESYLTASQFRYS